MAYDLRVITPQDFLRVDRSGEVDPEASRDMLKSAFKACADADIHHILLDVRKLHGELSFREISALASDLGRLGMNSNHRLAILHRPRAVQAPFLAELADRNGWTVKSFDNFEDAFHWLNEI